MVEKVLQAKYETFARNMYNDYDIFRVGKDIYTESTETQGRTEILYKAKVIRFDNGSRWNHYTNSFKWRCYILIDCFTFRNMVIIHKRKGYDVLIDYDI